MSSLTPQLELPVLVVDNAHWQNTASSGKEPQEYSVHTHQGFILSTGNFDFSVPDEMDFHGPNIIQIILGKDRLYAMAYEEEVTEYTVRAGNVVPLYGSAPFTGFEGGEKVILAIGHLSPSSEENPQPKFTVQWAGVVNIV
jgi:hypothetical protein